MGWPCEGRQTRKGSGLPYITHPLEVMGLLIRHGVRSEGVLAAAVLHDVAPEGRKEDALRQLRAGPPAARVVKMADRLSNILDLQVTGWSVEKQFAYLREAEAIAALGEAEHPGLCRHLRRVAAEQRERLTSAPA